jgi:hypothetical protein
VPATLNLSKITVDHQLSFISIFESYIRRLVLIG